MDLAAVLSSIFGVTTIIAAALAGLIYGNQRTLRESNKDLRDRVADLEAERAEDRADIATLKADRDALARVVTGEVHWQALTDTLNEHHVEAKRHWTREHQLLQTLVDRSSPGA